MLALDPELISPPVVLYPKQLAFAKDGVKVVGGTDSGHRVVYDLEGTVASCTNDNWHYVAIAGSTAEQASNILLW
ncbi:hypothetical protein Moror_12202 [Moniliophthora roreri MCA 2997]|uniref:Uncharacterized protein n=1 Tax=Moniliophthora roreri (strain MCA 2997) TaxID=1381753 RepID=V2W6D7_MONRO|nr:hypothetical protein Moror_12202 [Moniliophthora roreri MCA 2997]